MKKTLLLLTSLVSLVSIAAYAQDLTTDLSTDTSTDASMDARGGGGGHGGGPVGHGGGGPVDNHGGENHGGENHGGGIIDHGGHGGVVVHVGFHGGHDYRPHHDVFINQGNDWRFGFHFDHQFRVLIGVNYAEYADVYDLGYYSNYPVTYYGGGLYCNGELMVEPIVVEQIMQHYGVSYDQIVIVPTDDAVYNAAIFVNLPSGPEYVMDYNVAF